MQYLHRIVEKAGLQSQFLYIDGERVDRLPIPAPLKRGIGAVQCALQLLRLPEGEGDGVVHVNTSLYQSTIIRDAPVVLAARHRGLPVLLQTHGGRLANIEKSAFGRRVGHWLFRAVDQIGVFPGPQYREFEQAGYKEKLARMYNIVPQTEATVDRDGIPHFLFLGRLAPEKGSGLTLRAFLQLMEEGCTARLTIAGDGELLDELRVIARSSDHSNMIDIVGYVTGNDLNAVLEQTNIFVLPSRHQEGFPLSFLECAERGMACLVTKNSAIPEVFQEGVEFEPIDLNVPDDLYQKMKRVVEDVRHRAALGMAVQQAVRECCTIEAAAQRFKNIYWDLIRTEK
jgi:glycosyltransferase involved in cell wall biosynthesis